MGFVLDRRNKAAEFISYPTQLFTYIGLSYASSLVARIFSRVVKPDHVIEKCRDLVVNGLQIGLR